MGCITFRLVPAARLTGACYRHRIGSAMPDFKPHRRVVDLLVDRIYNQRLIENVQRGPYVEAIVADALDDEWAMTSTWADWDMQHVEGARVEVKSKAALQTWTDLDEGNPNVNPQFDIARREVASLKETGNEDNKKKFRPADIYVFAWHPIIDPVVADHRLVGQWRFFVSAECDLPAKQDSIILRRIREIGNDVGYDNLADAIDEVRRTLISFKKDEYADQPVRWRAGRPPQ